MNIWPFNIPEKRRIAARKRNEAAAKASVDRLIMLAQANADADMAFVNIHKINVTLLQRSLEASHLVWQMRAKAAEAESRRKAAYAKAEFDELTRRFEERMKGKK